MNNSIVTYWEWDVNELVWVDLTSELFGPNGFENSGNYIVQRIVDPHTDHTAVYYDVHVDNMLPGDFMSFLEKINTPDFISQQTAGE